MIALLRAESLRLLSRRFTVISLLALLLAIGAYQLQVVNELRAPSAEQVAQAETYVADAQREWEANHEEWEADCLAQPGSTPEQCQIPQPSLADYLGERDFISSATASVTFAGYLVAFALFLAAAGFIGAEFTSGSIGNWLSFVPRRTRVFASKLLVIVAFALLVGAVFLVGSVIVAVVAARAGDVAVTGLDDVWGLAARCLALPVILAALGFAVGLITRNTAAALGVLLGYLVVWFVRNALLSSQAWAQRLTPWSIEGNLSAFVDHGTTYAIPVITLTAEGPQYDALERQISFGQSAVYLAVLVAVVVAAAAVVFRRRDVH